MTEENSRHGCDAYSDNLAELALGILTGRDRAATLAHVEDCPACADELEHLARTADSIVGVAPETEPPMGFEVRLFERMGLSPADAPKSASVLRFTRRRQRTAGPAPVRRLLAVAASLVVLGGGLALGLSLSSSNSPQAPLALASADLIEHGQNVGHVFIYGGSRPWMFMNLADSSARGPVSCKVVMADGHTFTVGVFTASRGYGAWGAPLHVSPSSVRTAEVVSSNGTVIASATMA